MKTKNNKALVLLNQLIERAEQEDKAFRIKALQEHQASKAIGEGWWVFHLKILRDIVEADDQKSA